MEQAQDATGVDQGYGWVVTTGKDGKQCQSKCNSLADKVDDVLFQTSS